MKSLAETLPEIQSAIHAAQSHVSSGAEVDPRFGQFLDSVSSEAADATEENLGLWVAILEQSIQWLSMFHDVLGHATSSGDSEAVVVPYAIVAASIAQAVAIRRLCLEGLDTPARAVLRTLFESLGLAVLTAFEPVAEHEYLGTDDGEAARKFWARYAKRRIDKDTGAMSSRTSEVLGQVLGMSGHGDEHIASILRHYEQEASLASETVHLSLRAAMCTAKALSSNGSDLLPGRFGCSTLFSVRTLAQAAKWIWLFSRIVHPLLLQPIYDGKEGLFDLDISTREAAQELIAYHTTNLLVVSHWEDDDVPLPT